MMMSPGSKTAAISSMTASVASPACTMISARRGRSSAAANSAIVSVRTKSPSPPCSASSASVLAIERLCTATGVAVAGEVAGDVGAHHGEAGDPDLGGAAEGAVMDVSLAADESGQLRSHGIATARVGIDEHGRRRGVGGDGHPHGVGCVANRLMRARVIEPPTASAPSGAPR